MVKYERKCLSVFTGWVFSSSRCVSGTGGGTGSKAVSPETMCLPTLNVWLSQSQWMSNNYSPGGATGQPPPPQLTGSTLIHSITVYVTLCEIV